MQCINIDELNELSFNDIILSISLSLFWLHTSFCLACGRLQFICSLLIFCKFFILFLHPVHLLFLFLPSPLFLFHLLTLPFHTGTPSFHHCFLLSITLPDIRLRVRAEYMEHESALRNGVSSDKQQPLERQFELFSQANLLLRARELGSIICDIKFTELDNLEAFWVDYLNGDLLEALKGVFLTDSLRMAAGMESVRLLISVDEDDYEEGRRLLRAFGSRRMSSSNGGQPETHWAV